MICGRYHQTLDGCPACSMLSNIEKVFDKSRIEICVSTAVADCVFSKCHIVIREAHVKFSNCIFFETDLQTPKGSITLNFCTIRNISYGRNVNIRCIPEQETLERNKSAMFQAPTRRVRNRILCMGFREQSGPEGGYDYEPGKAYKAAWFDPDPYKECGAGLHLFFKEQPASFPGSQKLIVAYYMDEAIVAPRKARVPRFYVLPSKNRFKDVRAHHLEWDRCITVS